MHDNITTIMIYSPGALCVRYARQFLCIKLVSEATMSLLHLTLPSPSTQYNKVFMGIERTKIRVPRQNT